MTHQGDSPDALPPYVSARVDFFGDGGDFLKMMFKGAGLQLVTLGFYRFWFFTNIRRSLWADTSVRGDTLEYTGRGRELLIGFLFALAILAPFYVLYFLAGLAAESWKAWASLPLFAAFYLFGQFAIFRARRYRLTRTIWRGVRFWMTGSGLAYMVRAAGWTLLTFVTLGAALPWREAALERYKMRHTHYGDLQGRFEGTGWELFKSAAWIWAVLWLLVVAVLSLVAMLGFVVPQFQKLFNDMGDALPMPTRIVMGLGKAFTDYGLVLGIVAVGGGWLLVRWLRSPPGRLWWQTRALRVPVLGPLMLKYDLTLYARSLGTLLGNGVPMLMALHIATETVGNVVLRQALFRVTPIVKDGGRVVDAMVSTHIFEPLAISLMRVGEETGRMGPMMLELAAILDREVETGIKRALTLVEPVLILVLGVMIASIIVSILLGILSVNDLAV